MDVPLAELNILQRPDSTYKALSSAAGVQMWNYLADPD